MKYELERDCDLRGYWVEGLKEIQQWAQNALLIKEPNQIFIPDSFLRLFKDAHPKRDD